MFVVNGNRRKDSIMLMFLKELSSLATQYFEAETPDSLKKYKAHTVYITMHTYSIHTVCMFLYMQPCTVCMQQNYKYSGECRVYAKCVC